MQVTGFFPWFGKCRRTGVVGLVGLAIVSLALSGTWAADPAATATPARWTPTEPPNQPIGEAKGVFPGRVVWMHDPPRRPMGWRHQGQRLARRQVD